MTNPSDDRRHFSRIQFDAPVQLSQNDHAWQAKLLDLSLRGMLIETPQGPPIDPTRDLCARIILSEETTIAMQLRWCHGEEGHMGFECRNIDIDSISALRRLVELNLGDPELLERELAALGR